MVNRTMHLFITVTTAEAAESYAKGARLAGFHARITRKGQLFNVWIQAPR